MIYLYIKKLPTGLLYLGKTEQDPSKYIGSGNNWLKEIRNHGFTANDIETWILHETESKEEIAIFGRYYSKILNVVNSKLWANLKDEEGDGGATNTGRVVINNGKNHKFIHYDELQYFIEAGWERGYSKKTVEKIKKIKDDLGSNKIGATKSAKTRKENGSYISGAKKGIETKKRSGVFQKSILKMIESKKKNNSGHLGSIKAAKTKKQKGIPISGMQGKKHSQDTLEKLKGPKTEEHKIKLRKLKQKLKCGHCETYVDAGNMKRWHGENKCTIDK